MTLEEYVKKGKILDLEIVSSYHNHNYLCRHAVGTVADYVNIAKDRGLKIIGISDHGPIPDIHDRMEYEDMFDKYLPQFNIDVEGIKIYKGLELEYEYDMDQYYIDLKKNYDYFILGQHNVYTYGEKRPVHSMPMNDEDLIWYKESCIKALNTGLFEIFAHPEIVFYHNEVITPVGLECLGAVVKEAIKLNIPVEVNANGLRKKGIGKLKWRYPRQEYLDIIKRLNARIIVSDDAHDPNHICDEYTKILYSYLVEEGFNVDFNPIIVK